MKIAVAQLGARRHYAVPRILHEAGLLERFFTDSYVGDKPWLEAALRSVPRPIRPRSIDRWLGRKDAAIPPEKVTSFELFGIAYARARRRAKTAVERQAVFVEHGSRFGERIARSDLGRATVVWGFNSAALELFRGGKARGLLCVLEQTMAPHRVYLRLMRAELARWPGWQPNFDLDVERSPLIHREEAEWELADMIICGSQFVVDGIAECGGPVEKCRIVPYGVDQRRFSLRPGRECSPNDKLRVLFVGEVGLRKGAPGLLEALRVFGPDKVEARFAGSVALARDRLEPYQTVAKFLGAVPRTRMAELFAWADVFVLPSICEGSAVVTYEAISSGVPVICTPGTGVLESDAVTIVPPNDPDALVASLRSHQRNGQVTPISGSLREQYSIEAYAARLLAAMAGLEKRPGVPTL